MSEAPSEIKPRRLSEEQMHARYSVDSAMQHYKQKVYPGQRENWYHGRVSKDYRQNYQRIKWGKKL